MLALAASVRQSNGMGPFILREGECFTIAIAPDRHIVIRMKDTPVFLAAFSLTIDFDVFEAPDA